MNQESEKTQHRHQQNQTLVISNTGKKALSANQAAFNRLTEKIAKLQTEIDKKHRLFEAAIKLYAEKYYPGQQELAYQKRNILDILWAHYSSKRLSVTDQRNLKNILKEHLHDYLSVKGAVPDAAYKAMFAELEGEHFDVFEKKQNEFDKMMMQDLFDDLDVDIDLAEVDANDKDAIEKKLSEAREKLRERDEKIEVTREKRRQKKKKTKAAIAKETVIQNANELKQKNIGTIYKQLAKLFHPDLEQDEFKKAEKEVLMKELTVAYESKDLHALLQLELKWIHKEHDYLEKLSDEKLGVYLQILREQTGALEREKNQMAMRPQYSVLVAEFGFAVVQQPLKEVEENYRLLKNELDSILELSAALDSELGLRQVKNMIKAWKQIKRQQQAFGNDVDLPF